MRVVKSIKPLGFPWETLDPFLFCVHHRDLYPAGNEEMAPDRSFLSGRIPGNDFINKDGWRMYHGQKIPGFPYHPHRGFETVTINLQGYVDHTDSLGGAGRFGKGDVQWMTAGKGILHSEMFPLVHEDKENTLEIFQIWLNLPQKSKMVDPHFKMLWAEEIPRLHVSSDTGWTSMRVIAGQINGTKALPPTPDSWAADPENGVLILTLEMQAGAVINFPAAHESFNRTLYLYDGLQVTLENETLKKGHLAHLEAGQSCTIRNGDSPSKLLLLQGRPINEPVAQHGPFVMNTEEEIREAFEEYRRTQFGGWPWPDQEQVHERNRGRFALHSDGKEEIPSALVR